MESYPDGHKYHFRRQSNAWLSLLAGLSNPLTHKPAMLSGGAEALGLPQALKILYSVLEDFPETGTYVPNVLGDPESLKEHTGFMLRHRLAPLFEACQLNALGASSLESVCDVEAGKCVIDLSTLSSKVERDKLLLNLFRLMQGLAYVVIQNPVKKHKKPYQAAVKVFYGESSHQLLCVDEYRAESPDFFILAADVLKLFSYEADLLKAKPVAKTWPHYLAVRSHNLEVIGGDDKKNSILKNGSFHTFSKMLTNQGWQREAIQFFLNSEALQSIPQPLEQDAAVSTVSQHHIQKSFSDVSNHSLEFSDLLKAEDYTDFNHHARQGRRKDFSPEAQLEQLAELGPALDPLWRNLTDQEQCQLLMRWFELRRLETCSSAWHSGDSCTEELFLKLYQDAALQVWQQIHDGRTGEPGLKGDWFNREKKDLEGYTVAYFRKAFKHKDYFQVPEQYYFAQFLARQYKRRKLAVPSQISEASSCQLNWNNKPKCRFGLSRRKAPNLTLKADDEVELFDRVLIGVLSLLSALSVVGLLVLMTVSNTLMMTQLALVLIPALVWIHAQMYHLFYEKIRLSLRDVGFNVLGVICFLGLGAIAAFIVPTNFIAPPIFMLCVLLSIPPLMSEVCHIMRWGYRDVALNNSSSAGPIAPCDVPRAIPRDHEEPKHAARNFSPIQSVKLGK